MLTVIQLCGITDSNIMYTNGYDAFSGDYLHIKIKSMTI